MKSHSIPRKARACSELVESDGEQTCLERPVVSKVEPSRKSRTILVSLIIALLAGTAADARYSGGTGDPNNPYRIATAEDLNDIGNHLEDLDKHFILVNDVNLAEFTGTQFKIVGRWIDWSNPNNKPFTGVFDGNDHKIWNFTWKSTVRNGIGLFGYLGSDGQIENLGLENVDVNAVNGDCVGGLVGENYMGEITNCCSTGSVLGNPYVGGLVGENYMGGITNCYSTNDVNGNDYVGGLAGLNYGTIISNCYSNGNVTGEDYVGGLVGLSSAFYNYATMTNCYSTASVSGYQWVGGLVGYNAHAYGTINDCYSIGSVSGTLDVGGLVGRNEKGTVSNCYSTGNVTGVTGARRGGGLVGWNEKGTIGSSFWDVNTSDWTTSDGGTPKTTAEMKTKSTFTNAGWDFVEVWGIGEGQIYPFLRTEPAGDSNYDKKVDLIDLAILASHWLEGPP